MFQAAVLKRSLEYLGLTEDQRLEVSTLRVFGLPESVIGTRVQALNLDPRIYISYRAHFPDITLQLKLAGDSALLAQSSALCREAIGPEFIFSLEPKDNLEQVCAKLLIERGLTIGVAESCTGGMLGSFLTNIAGSSKYFIGGIQSYSNTVKSSQLGVSPELIAQNGAVSKEVAIAMAEGARKALKSDLALSITGIAGPDGGSELKPVGTFMIGLATSQSSTALHYFFASSRERIREYAAWSALDTLRRYLLGLPFRAEFKDLASNAR